MNNSRTCSKAGDTPEKWLEKQLDYGRNIEKNV